MITSSDLLGFAIERRASDLHISAGEPPMVRIQGDLVRIDHPPLLADETHRLIFEVMNGSQHPHFQEHLEVDFSYTLGGGPRFRVNAFMHDRGEGAVFRQIPAKIPRLVGEAPRRPMSGVHMVNGAVVPAVVGGRLPQASER